jgi:Methyltransferase domain
MIHPSYHIKKLLRPFRVPTLADLNRVAVFQTTDPSRILLETAGSPRDQAKIYERELEEALWQNPESFGDLGLPGDWKIDEDAARLVYSLIRVYAPRIVVETGIGNGFSSFAILSALEANGKGGRLVSYDTRTEVGGFVPPALRSDWEIRNSVYGRSSASDPLIDLFLHDSDHGYTNQLREYRLAWSRLLPGGILASDDIDCSFAIEVFSKEVNVRPYVLVGYRKCFAIFLKPPETRNGS